MLNEKKLWECITDYRSVTNDDRIGGNFLTPENITRCLNLYDNITENFGIFREIMHEIKNDFIEAIYSHRITACEKENVDVIERIPYFMLYKNTVTLQKGKILEMEQLNESLEKELQKQSERCEYLQEINQHRDKECSDYKNREIEHQHTINQLETEIEILKLNNLEMETKLNNKIDQIKKENNKIKSELHQQKVMTDDLQVYKEAHEHLDKTFMQACQEGHDDNLEAKDSFNKKANLEMEIKTITTMNNDITQLENLMLDDIDKRSSNFKQKILEYKYFPDNKSRQEEHEIDDLIAKSIMDFNKSKISFQHEFAQIQIESLMLQNHQAVLINDWAAIHEAELENEPVEIKNIKTSFVFDEKIMNKYSVIVCLSNDGQTFYESKATRFCESCGIKVVFCPHNAHEKETVIKLPAGSTHMKIQRPVLKLNSKYAKYFISKPAQMTEEKAETVSSEERKQSSRKSFRSSYSSSDSEMMIPFDSLLEDFHIRTNMDRGSPRKYNEYQILSIIEDFWATILNEDEYAPQLSEITTLLDKLYLFFLDRYGHEKAAMLSLYDFLASVIGFAESSQFIQLFCHVLIANIDSSVMRYLFHLVDCLEIIHWKKEDDLRQFLSIVQPFLSEDDIDSIVLSYISYSENIYHKEKVFEFLLYNFLKERDPRFSWVQSEALNLKTLASGFYTFTEFQVLLDSVTSLPDKKLSIRLFKELAIFYTEEGSTEYAPLTKISEIVAFLSFLESVENIKQSLHDKYDNDTEDFKSEPLRWSYCRLTNLASVLLRET